MTRRRTRFGPASWVPALTDKAKQLRLRGGSGAPVLLDDLFCLIILMLGRFIMRCPLIMLGGGIKRPYFLSLRVILRPRYQNLRPIIPGIRANVRVVHEANGERAGDGCQERLNAVKVEVIRVDSKT